MDKLPKRVVGQYKIQHLSVSALGNKQEMSAEKRIADHPKSVIWLGKIVQ
jgi:hypothetical protein